VLHDSLLFFWISIDPVVDFSSGWLAAAAKAAYPSIDDELIYSKL
jgi:hypothetical protein